VDESERGCLKAETGPDGEGSRGVLRKCGFEHTGTREVEEDGGSVMLDCWRCERRRSS
jgi:RimJ/RimL family protein N-acetyltransferase